jgi:exonuclease III
VTWNLAYMKPGRYKTIANRRRQWALLAALEPDIALLQECRPDDLRINAPAWMEADYDVIGEIPPNWIACSAILARTTVEARPLDRTQLPEPEHGWLAQLSGYVATALAVVRETELAIASVHAIAREVDRSAATDEDHERIRRRSHPRAWHNDLAVAALTPWVRNQRFIVGGDWNTAVLFDSNYPAGAEGGPGASAEFFANRAAGGWHHALRKFCPTEVRTYLDPASGPYELDHIFTDPDFHARLTGCRVVDDAVISELSDHAPLVAEFEL